MSRDRISQAQNTQKASLPQNNGQKAMIAARLPYQKQQLSYLQQKLAEMRASNEQFNSENGDQPNYFREAQQMRESNYSNQIASLQQEISSGSASIGNLNFSSSQGNSSGSIGNFSSFSGQENPLSSMGNFNSSGAGAGITSNQSSPSAASGGSILDDIGSIGKSIGNALTDGLQKIGKGISDGANWFVSQLKGDSNSNEDCSNEKNSNCGPTSLLMVARMFGAMGGGSADADGEIEQIRKMMGADSDESKWTDTNQIVQGAQAMGLSAQSSGKNDANSVEKELSNGKKVIVNVDPAGYSGGPSSGHFAVVTAINGDQVTLYDPAKQAPITISKSQLTDSMNARGGFMVSISK